MAAYIDALFKRKERWSKDDFVFFWGHTNKGDSVTKACLSQWYPCSFVIDDQYYNCAEQYMMAEKARIFGDEPIRQQILSETDQLTIKRLGRKVSGFDGEVWDRERYNVVVRGNLGKFSQNLHLREFLLSTGDKVLVEASPKDAIWGIGLDEFNPDACDPSKWAGLNLLGFALMQVRDQLSKAQITYE